tara:strand:- start:328 stop:510 length:183 start_codon:yes stop_codon:yes gene_type:complete
METTAKFEREQTVNVLGLNQKATILTVYSESMRRKTGQDYLVVLFDGTEAEAKEDQLEAA